MDWVEYLFVGMVWVRDLGVKGLYWLKGCWVLLLRDWMGRGSFVYCREYVWFIWAKYSGSAVVVCIDWRVGCVMRRLFSGSA
ncbi:hypothetical protein HanPI659440_Chr06g0241111 [Helianthus annuus]|nr:hypothetical protein HanPI659440_Chr06g0241111 [Helianthus annuus]